MNQKRKTFSIWRLGIFTPCLENVSTYFICYLPICFVQKQCKEFFSSQCFRYNALVQVHGKLDRLVSIDLTPESKVQVTIVCGDNCEQHVLDVYQTVSEFKQKFEKFSGIPAHRMRVFYVDQQVCSVIGPEEMKFPNKRLYSYNIVKGDQIIVDSKK